MQIYKTIKGRLPYCQIMMRNRRKRGKMINQKKRLKKRNYIKINIEKMKQ